MFTGGRLLSAACTAIFFHLLVFQTCHARSIKKLCTPSSCGNILNISYPFRLDSDPQNCGDQRYNLHCENNSTVLYLYSGKYYVQAINYNNFTIRLVDAGVQKDNCSSLPLFSLVRTNFSLVDPYALYYYNWTERSPILSQAMIFVSCAKPVNSLLYVDTSPCNVGGLDSSISYHPLKMHSYISAREMVASELLELCRIEMMVMLPEEKDCTNMSFKEIHRELASGFELSWYNIYCGNCKKSCYINNANSRECSMPSPLLEKITFRLLAVLFFLGLIQVPKVVCGTPCVIALLIYKWKRRHLSVYDNVEEFLKSNNNLKPVTYSFSDIRKITGGFKDKLGEGGFGSVYKGKLRSGHFAAVKMLIKSEANGQDFINEVATIGRIHHANVVRLIGFCAERSKRALVYDFMPNGSLDSYIGSPEGSTSLSWEKLYEISLGVARGIEYLHRGCEIQILHFDIKPHNILLDENFTPKISDFGLAKLHPTKGSIVSLTAARGTIGYMAPELFYKNFGRVSYKADVYSFGMLLLEMAGKRKHLDTVAEKSSQKYWPYWVYEQVYSGKIIDIEDNATVEESMIVKKMVIVGLWCIQMNPINRPAMNQVVEMLDGDYESLQLPPKPNLNPKQTSITVVRESTSSSDDSTESSSSD